MADSYPDPSIADLSVDPPVTTLSVDPPITTLSVDPLIADSPFDPLIGDLSADLQQQKILWHLYVDLFYDPSIIERLLVPPTDFSDDPPIAALYLLTPWQLFLSVAPPVSDLHVDLPIANLC